MKKNVIIFGLVSGIIITGMMMYSAIALYNGEHFEPNMVLGYAAMLAAFSFVFVGIRNYRNKYKGGVISFGKAFIAGLYITLIAGTIYTGVWLVIHYMFMPDFMDRYVAFALDNAAKNGADSKELAVQARDMATYQELYKNPFWVVVFTYGEVLPVGLLVTLISAFVLKKRKQEGIESYVNG